MTVACIKPCGGCFALAEQVVQAVVDPLKKVFQRTMASSKTAADKPTWERITLRKINEKGEFYKYVDKERGVITDKDALFEFVVHNPSGMLYKDESQLIVAYKCFLIAIGNPIFAISKSLWHLGKIVAGTIFVALRCFSLMISSSKEGGSSILKRHVQQISDLFTQNMYRALTAPLYALGVEAGALVGIFFPYEGRRIVAHVESLSQEGQGVKNVSCLLNDLEAGTLKSLDDYADAFLRREVCFLAFCFQPRGSIKDEPNKYHIEERKPISFYYKT